MLHILSARHKLVSRYLTIVGFRGVEFGSEVVLQYSKEDLFAAKENARVEVINMSTSLGQAQLNAQLNAHSTVASYGVCNSMVYLW